MWMLIYKDKCCICSIPEMEEVSGSSVGLYNDHVHLHFSRIIYVDISGSNVKRGRGHPLSRNQGELTTEL